MDLDGDGHLDVISGSWPGELFLFRGGPGDGPNRSFGPPEMIKDRDGRVINVSGGVHEQKDGSIEIAGNAKWEETPEGSVVEYQGKKYKSTPDKPVFTTGIASAVHAVDWDGDGDLDLLVGDISGDVYLVPNEGSARSYAFGKAQPLPAGAGGEPLKVEGDAGPFAADWDGDGDLDLLVGSGTGSVSLYRNLGTARAPRLAAAETLVPAGETAFGPGAPREPRRGIRSKVCAADWNGDGRLDLLVGDFATQAPDLPEPTAAEKAQHDVSRKQLDTVQKQYSELVQKVFGPGRVRTKEELEKVQKELGDLGSRMQELRSKLPPEYEDHGWVWLFLRKPAAAGAGER